VALRWVARALHSNVELDSSTEIGSERCRGSWFGYGAALWALIFAALHVVWALGWYIGLQQELARKAFQQRWFLVYDLVVAGLCALAVAVALALVQPWGRRLPRSLIGVLGWGGAGLLSLRGGVSVVQAAYIEATGGKAILGFALWDVWFCLGGVLFGVSIWRFWRASGLRGSRRRADGIC
jgi:hypothetical protein